MFSVYSSSPVGILGAIVDTTNVKGILKLDCNATDFYAPKHYPVYLYYNPFDEDKEVDYTSAQQVDLFDIVAKEYVARNIMEKGCFTIPAKATRVVVELPVETELTKEGQRIVANKQYIISYK